VQHVGFNWRNVVEGMRKWMVVQESFIHQTMCRESNINCPESKLVNLEALPTNLQLFVELFDTVVAQKPSTQAKDCLECLRPSRDNVFFG
jgi:hypothetical protein